MPTEKKYARTIVGRSLNQSQRRGNPMLAMMAASALPTIIPMVLPLIGNVLKGLTGNGTRLAGEGRKKKRSYRK